MRSCRPALPTDMFVLRMALRELRASWRRLLFFFLCVAVGVGAIVALRSVIQSLRAGLMREARTLIASDVDRADEPPLDARRRGAHRRRCSPRRRSLARTESIETPTMVRPERGARGGADGRAARASRRRFRSTGRSSSPEVSRTRTICCAKRGALVGPELLAQLGISSRRSADDRRPAVHHPRRDREGAGPADRRVQLRLARHHRSATTCGQTGLLGFGSRASYQMLLKVEPTASTV